MKKSISLLLALLMFIAGCAGREGNPVSIHQLGDTSKSCDSLREELYFIESEIARLVPKSDKMGRNIACGATGIIFIIPLFFMDLKQGEKIEVEAYRQRYNHLLMIAKEKGCKLFEVESEKTQANPTANAIDNAKWSEGKAIMNTVSIAIRAYAAEMGPDGELPKTLGDLGFVTGDLEGSYFGESDFTFSVSSMNPLTYIIVCTPQEKSEAPTVPVRITLNQDGVWTSD